MKNTTHSSIKLFKKSSSADQPSLNYACQEKVFSPTALVCNALVIPNTINELCTGTQTQKVQGSGEFRKRNQGQGTKTALFQVSKTKRRYLLFKFTWMLCWILCIPSFPPFHRKKAVSKELPPRNDF